MTILSKSLWIVAVVGISGLGATQAPATNYAIVDTYQEACYSDRGWMPCTRSGGDFFGQDAQYDGLQTSYTDWAFYVSPHGKISGQCRSGISRELVCVPR